jgi:hypothetical protein
MATVVDLSPLRLDMLGVRAGDRNTYTLHIKQDGVPMDLTGLTPRAQVRTKATDEIHMVEAVIDVVDAVGGQLVLRWPGDDIRALVGRHASFTGVWDMQLESGGEADPWTILAGAFRADMDVTR